MSRDPAALHPELRSRWERLERACAAIGCPVVLTQGLRTRAEQDALYAQGRTSPGKRVTNARGGDSAHNYGRAFDVAFVGGDGKPSWAETHPWTLVGVLGEYLGLQWGGRWRAPDRPHFQWFAAGESIEGLKAEAERLGRPA